MESERGILAAAPTEDDFFFHLFSYYDLAAQTMKGLETLPVNIECYF